MRLSLIALIFFLVVLPFADMNLIQNPDFGFPILEGHSKVYHEGFPKGWEGIPQMEIVKGERHNKRWAPGVQVCQMSLFNGFGSSVNQKIIVKLDPQGSPVHTLGLSYALREETRTPIWSYK